MRTRGRSSGAPAIVGLLDVGSTKVACMIAEIVPGGPAGASARLLGLGHQRSRGVKAGVIVNLDEAEAAIRAALGQAERMAGITLEEVVVAVACGRIKSANFAAHARLPHGVVEEDDIERAFVGAEAYADRDGRSLVQLTPNGFQLDGAGGIADPRGMAGQRLTLNVNAITADDAPLRNLLAAIERCHVGVAGIVAAPYASALAAATPEERRLGVVSVDIGGGMTTIAAIVDHCLVHADVILAGGNLISFDIARALSTPLHEAERIKVLYGTMSKAQSDEREIIHYPIAGEEAGLAGSVGEASRARIARLVAPRIDALLEQVRERLATGGLLDRVADRVVLTGGASQLAGLAGYAADRLGRPVRVGRGVCEGVPESASEPPFAAVIGLLCASMAPRSVVRPYRDRNLLAPGYLGRFRDWVRGF